MKEPWGCAVYEGTLLEAELPHDLDGVILHSSGESRQHHESRIMGIEEDSKRLGRRRDDAPSDGVVRQLK